MQKSLRPISNSLLITGALLAASAWGQLTAVNPGYNLVNMMPGGIQPVVAGMDFLSDGRLVFCTWGGDYNKMVPPSTRGELYVVSGIDKGDQAQMTATKIYSGLQEPLGLKVVHDTIYLSERQALAAVFDKNGNGKIDADEYWKVSPYTDGGQRHEFFFGLVYKNGLIYGAHSLNLVAGGSAAVPQPDANRGTYLTVDPKTGKTEYISGGAREPFGMTLLPNGEILGTEVQGGWNPACALTFVRPGKFYGHPLVNQSPASPFDNMPYQPPAVLMQESEIANVPGEPAYIPKGIFKGQVFYGDVTYGGIQRAWFEKAGGDYQGGLVRFSAGFLGGVGRLKFAPNGDLIVGMTGDPSGNWHQADKGQVWGLQKLVPNGKSTFEILRAVSRPEGMEIEFTDQVGPTGDQAANYVVDTWTYKRTSSYGGPKVNQKTLSVSSVQVDAGRKKVYLKISGLATKEYVVHIKMGNVKSASGASLWSAELWHTLNALGTGAPFSDVPYDPFDPASVSLKPGQADAARVSVSRLPGTTALNVNVPGAYEVKVFDVRGSVVAEFRGASGGSFSLPVSGLRPGTYTAVVRSGEERVRSAFVAF